MHTLILAAGRGSRFGGGLKQLALIDGQSMAQRAINLAQAITPEQVTVVLGYEHEQINAQIELARTMVNPHWQEGISSSITLGVASLPESASAVLIYLCDQVAITAADLKVLCEAYEASISDESSPIICAAYAGSLGVPAIFPRAYFSQLIALEGDRGAKHLLNSNPVRSLSMEAAATDIDTYLQWVDFTERSIIAEPDIEKSNILKL